MSVLLRNINHFGTSLIIAAITFACSGEEQVLNNTDLIFPNSIRVSINAYTYTDEFQHKYQVQGDSILFTQRPDTLNNRPEFHWSYVPLITTVAVFTAPIQVEKGEVKNTEELIWQWHSGMPADSLGRIKYSEGKTVLNGTINYSEEAVSLEPGTYYWAVWGWNSSATEIFFSSRQMKFIVPE